MTTVFPTPAPPKSPTFPPLSTGQMRSMTLMPVSRISTLIACLTYSGALRWIGNLFLATTSLPSSITSPRTLKIRPRVTLPTGTEIGAPVSVTSTPRARPSVESMATVRTTPPPKCCSTSRIIFLLPFLTDKAL